MTLTLIEGSDGRMDTYAYDCHTATAAPGKAALTGSLVRDQAQRLVPQPGIGVAPPGGETLVGIQTLFWAETAAQRALGPVRLLGHHVDLEVTAATVAWDLGDGTQNESRGPGRPYTQTDPCTTRLCPGYYGHVYQAVGAVMVTATVTWTGRYRVDGGGWQQIPGTVTGSTSTLQLTVRQARGVLVPDPRS